MAGRKRKSAPVTEEAPATPTLDAPASRRRSQRVSSSASAQKSKYFEADSDSESASKHGRAKGRSSKKKAKVEPETESDEDDYKDEPEATQDAQDAQASEDSELDEDAPPKVTFIPLPKLRDTGGIDYADDRLHPNTLAFLADLKANNKRSWLKLHDAEYRRALKDWESYITALTDKIIAVDSTIPDLPYKDVGFRIYRDIRFTTDPTPYKPHFSAAFSRTGRKGPYACYYLHLEPGGLSMVGGGLWHPSGEALARLRASIDERPQWWRRVLGEQAFGETFLNLGSSSKPKGKKGEKKLEEKEEAAIKAFAERNKEGALKTRPKGFVPDHRDMALLKLRNFTVGKKLGDGVFTAEEGQEEVAGVVGAMVGFITHLNRIVMPDPGDEEEEDDDEEEEDE